MAPPGLTRIALLATLVALLPVGKWVADGLPPACSGSGRAGSSTPIAALPCTQRDLGTAPQGVVLRATFPISNAGTRRLVLVKEDGECCGQSVGPQPIILNPGEQADLTVEVDTAQWFGRLKHRVHYSTNDPGLPQFALQVNAMIEGPLGDPEQRSP